MRGWYSHAHLHGPVIYGLVVVTCTHDAWHLVQYLVECQSIVSAVSSGWKRLNTCGRNCSGSWRCVVTLCPRTMTSWLCLLRWTTVSKRWPRLRSAVTHPKPPLPYPYTTLPDPLHSSPLLPQPPPLTYLHT